LPSLGYLLVDSQTSGLCSFKNLNFNLIMYFELGIFSIKKLLLPYLFLTKQLPAHSLSIDILQQHRAVSLRQHGCVVCSGQGESYGWRRSHHGVGFIAV